MSQPTLKVSVAKASNGSVLLIHEERNLDAILRPLTEAGYRVVWARSTKQGLEEAMKGTFDIVLCDIDLSADHVVDALSIIRAYEKELPIVLVSDALGERSNEPKNLQALAPHDRLERPFTRDRLLEVVEIAMEKSRGPHARLRIDAKDATPFATGATAPAISMKRSRPQNIPTAPARSSNKLGRALASMRVELDTIFDANELRIVGYEARVLSEEPALAGNPGLLASAGVELLRKRTRDLAAQAFAVAPRGTKLFLDLTTTDLLDTDLYTPEAPLSRIADRVVLQLRENSSLPLADLGARLSVLRFLGFRLAVADLETGPARLSLLADVTPEYVKIDATLTRGVDASSAKRRVVEGLVSMSRMLGSTPVAEGVATAEERATLVKLGCSLVQGPLHQPDLPAVATLRSRRHSRRLGAIRRPSTDRCVRG